MDVVSFNGIGYNNDVELWKKAWNECINLRKLCVQLWCAEQAEAIFSNAEDHLKILKLQLTFMDENEVRKSWIIVQTEQNALKNLCRKGFDIDASCIAELEAWKENDAGR